LTLVLGLVFLLGIGLAALFLFDPADHAFYPVCLFKRMTGYDCPGCGGLRAVHGLLHGDVWRAFQLNAVAVVALPLLVAWSVLRWVRSRRGQPAALPVRFLAWMLVGLIVVFGVIRNLPFWPFGVTPM